MVPWEVSFANWMNSSHKVSCIPVKFNITTNQFKVTKSKLVYYLWFLRIFFLFLDNIYLLYQFNYVTPSTVDSEEFMNFYVHAFPRVSASLMTISVAFGLQGTVYLFNVIYYTLRIWKNAEHFGNRSCPFTGPVCNGLNRLIKL